MGKTPPQNHCPKRKQHFQRRRRTRSCRRIRPQCCAPLEDTQQRPTTAKRRYSWFYTREGSDGPGYVCAIASHEPCNKQLPASHFQEQTKDVCISAVTESSTALLNPELTRAPKGHYVFQLLPSSRSTTCSAGTHRLCTGPQEPGVPPPPLQVS